MRSALRYLATLVGRADDDERYLVEFGVILVLIAVVALLSLVLFGDAIADLITLVGGRVDEQTLGH